MASVDRVVNQGLGLLVKICTAGILVLAFETSAFAIPSPELVVGSFTSISQLFALGSALLGGGATVATLRMRSRGAQSRSIFAVALGAFLGAIARRTTEAAKAQALAAEVADKLLANPVIESYRIEVD